MSIMVPTGCKLDIENKYGDVVIGMNVDEAKLEINNGALDAQDIKDLKLTGNYCNANLGNIDKAESRVHQWHLPRPEYQRPGYGFKILYHRV